MGGRTVVLGVQESYALEVMHTGARQAVHTGAERARQLVCTRACAHCSQGGLHPGGRCARGLCTWEITHWCQTGCAQWCWVCRRAVH